MPDNAASLILSVMALVIALLSAHYTRQRVVIERERETWRRRQERSAHLHALYQAAPEGYIVLISNYGDGHAHRVAITCMSRANGEIRWTDQVPVIGPRSTFHSEHHWNHARDDLIIRLQWSDAEENTNTYETTL